MKKFNTDNHATIVIAKIQDTPSDSVKALNRNEHPNASTNRMRQMGASHYLVQSIFGPQEYIIRSSQGIPRLSHSKNYISISHNPESIAVITSAQPVAIDIELADRNVSHVAKKFTEEREVKMISKEFLSNPEIVIWTQKECLFKIIKAVGVDFKSHLKLQSSHAENDRLRCEYLVSHDDCHGRYLIESFIFDKTIISYIDRPIIK